jgi:hypothetical protein
MEILHIKTSGLHIHCGIIHNGQVRESASMPTNGLMDKENVCKRKGESLSH